MKQALRGGQLAHLSLLRRHPLVGLLENLPTRWVIVKVFRIGDCVARTYENSLVNANSTFEASSAISKLVST